MQPTLQSRLATKHSDRIKAECISGTPEGARALTTFAADFVFPATAHAAASTGWSCVLSRGQTGRGGRFL